jgi:hypothetical protein
MSCWNPLQAVEADCNESHTFIPNTIARTEAKKKTIELSTGSS